MCKKTTYLHITITEWEQLPAQKLGTRGRAFTVRIQVQRPREASTPWGPVEQRPQPPVVWKLKRLLIYHEGRPQGEKDMAPSRSACWPTSTITPETFKSPVDRMPTRFEKGSETEPLGGRIRPTWHRLVDTTQRPARFHRFAFAQGRAGTGSRLLALLLFMPFPFRFQARVILLMTAHGFYIFESYVELYYYGCWFSVYLLYLLGGYCWYLENNE